MKSIRLSLSMYFLVLLALSLGAASLLAYQTTRYILLEKKQALRDLLRAQHEERVREIGELVDNTLHFHAQTLANVAFLQQDWNRPRWHRGLSLAHLSGMTGPNAHITTGVWLSFLAPGRLGDTLHQMLVTKIEISEEQLPRFSVGQVTEYFQINNQWGNAWRSRSMGEQRFSVDANMFAATVPLVPKFDDTELASGIKVRRVMLKAPVAAMQFQWGQFQGGPRFGRSGFTGPPGPGQRGPGGGPGGGLLERARWPDPTGSDQARPNRDGPQEKGSSQRATPPPPPPSPRPTPPIFIQCACDTTLRDASIKELDTGFEDDLVRLELESHATLATLRNRLLWFALITFGATVLGSFFLVQLGLWPLRRLSEAVSQVSERDFRLQFDESRLPQELRPIVERLTQTLDQLKRAFAREKQAAADISHDLRTPVAALLTTTEVALRKARSADEYREIIAECRSTGQQMNQLVERLMALARLDAGVDHLRPRETDVTALAEQCAGLVRPLAEARGLSLRVHTNGPIHLCVDPDKLREVLTNLLHNAIEYNRPQGSVDLKVERENGHLSLEVRDTGIGVSSEAREHIFERFYRGDPARQADGLHTGLGLAIVKGYVDLMGGTIGVESAVQQGSTFRIELPVS